jgi:hypothetical protein
MADTKQRFLKGASGDVHLWNDTLSRSPGVTECDKNGKPLPSVEAQKQDPKAPAKP